MTVSHAFDKKALLVGVLGLVGSLIGAITQKEAFFVGYLQAFGFWTALSIGCLGITQIHGLTGGAWGEVIRPFLQSGIKMLPISLVMVLPILAAGPTLYHWMDPQVVANNHLLHVKHLWLNQTGFVVRTFIYFGVWIVFGVLTLKGKERPSRFVCGLGFLLCSLATSFAAFDWFMSIEPEWFSSIYGAMYMIACGLATFTVSLLLALKFNRQMTTNQMHDLGKFLLMSVMIWAYFNFSQLLIIWAAEIPEEMTWYHHRLQGGWQWLGIVLVVGHFFVPFLLLLSRQLKRNQKFLVGICFYLLFFRMLDFWFLIKPAFSHHAITFPLWELVAMAAVGGIYMFGYTRHLQRFSEVVHTQPVVRDSHGPQDRQ